MRKALIRIFACLLLLPFAILGAALAWPPFHPGKSKLDLQSARAMALDDLPKTERFTARDGARLAYRSYAGKPGGGVAVLIHGSSASGMAMHAMARALSAEGVSVIVPDMRGHGANVPRGDLAYIGQLDHDMADLARVLDRRFVGERRVLAGHSSGGGFVLRVAGGEQRCHFDGYLALSPYLNHQAPTARPGNGNWSASSYPRIFALTFLDKSHVSALGGLPVLAFAVPRGTRSLTGTYSYRLMRSFGLDFLDWETPLRRIDRPAVTLVGSADELFYPERYAPTLRRLNPAMGVAVLPGVNHLGMITDWRALAATQAAITHLLSMAGPAKRCL